MIHPKRKELSVCMLEQSCISNDLQTVPCQRSEQCIRAGRIGIQQEWGMSLQTKNHQLRIKHLHRHIAITWICRVCLRFLDLLAVTLFCWNKQMLTEFSTWLAHHCQHIVYLCMQLS
jgi:hypothetical protein